MDGSRKRLVPFMRRMIGRCPGVTWENQDEGTFRIPWRHFNNREWTEEDSRIFLEWAKATGKYKDGDVYEWPSWKTQLRCALNKIPDIEPVPELYKLDIPNPYRVYKFVSTPNSNSSDAETPYAQSPDSTMDDKTSPRALKDLDRILKKQLGGYDSSHPSPKRSPGLQMQGYEYQVYHSPSLVPTVVEEIEDTGNNQYLVLSNADVQAHENQTYVMYQQVMQSDHTVGKREIEATDFLTNEVYHTPMMIVQHPVNNMPELSSKPMQTLGVMSTPNIPVTNSLNNNISNTTVTDNETVSMETSLPSDLKSLEMGNLCPCDVQIGSEALSSVPSSFGSNPSVPLANGPQQPGDSPEGAEKVRKEIRALCSSKADRVPGEKVVLTFRLFYGCQKQCKVLTGKVTRKGCRFYFPKTDPSFWNNTVLKTPEVFGPPSVQQIVLPCEEEFPEIEADQRAKLQQLLENTERGLVLTCKEEDIYAQRLCKTRVFVTDGTSNSLLLERHQSPVKIFDFHHQRGLKKSVQILTFGQEIKKGHKEPMKKVLMSVEIEHQGLKSMMEEHYPSTNSSIDDPLISHDDKNDVLLNCFSKLSVGQSQNK